jgi:HlyD family type I secretion membrane fusion protein
MISGSSNSKVQPNTNNGDLRSAPVDVGVDVGNRALIRVLIVDDQKTARQAVKFILEAETDMQVVGTASDGESCIEQVESLHPDIVLIDIEMPQINGIEATAIISEHFPDTKAIVLSIHESEEYFSQSLAAGAKGYILKNAPSHQIVNAIRSVYQGYSCFGPGLLEKILVAQPDAQIDDDSDLDAAKQDETIPPFLPTAQVNDFLPSISNWLVFGGMSVVIALVAAVPVSAILKYKTTVQAQATVRPAGELRIVQASTQGRVKNIFVKGGQVVRKGEIIATIDDSSLLTKQNQLQDRIGQQRLQLEKFNAQISQIDSQIIAEGDRNQASVTAAQAEFAGSRRNYQDKQTTAATEVREIQAKLKATEATLSAAKVKAARYQMVELEGAISKDQVAEVELAVRQQEQELAATQASLQRANAALNPNRAEMAIAQKRIAQEENSGRAAIASLQREKEAIVQQQIEANKQLQQDRRELKQVKIDLRQTTITATSDGTISQLKLRNSDQTVQPGEEVAQIVPSNAPLEIKAAVSPSDVGKLKQGQIVQMRVSACSYTDYGTLKGTVKQISPDTIRAQNNDLVNDSSSGASQAQAFYEVTISPANLTLGKGKNQCLLQLGMEGRADIITKEESVLKFLLRKARLLVDV